MKYAIEFSPEAKEDLVVFRAVERSAILDAVESHLRYEPRKESKSRIKALKGVLKPQYRLRVDRVRVFYDVVDDVVQIIAIVEKEYTTQWLDREAVKMEEREI